MHIYPSLGLTSYPVGTEPELPFSWKIRMNEMKELLAFLLAANFMKMTSTAPVFTDEGEGNENEAGEGGSDNDEKENSVPGFEFALGVCTAIAAARLLRARLA
jgi:hypothetical protein